MDGPRTRRDFLRLAAGAAAAATATSCGSRSGKPEANAGGRKGGAKGDRALRIALWSHFIPSYDAWFDQEYTRQWGEKNGFEVVVDHIPYAELGARAGAEVAAQRGHDLFGFIAPPAVFEDEVIDHREIVDEVGAKLGPLSSVVERNVSNPRTGKYFGFPEYWVPNPVHYRVDLWRQVGLGKGPQTWDDVLRAAPELKAMGYPLGIGMSPDDDSNFSLFGLLAAYGSRIQDEEGGVAINSPATVEAVKIGAAIYRAGMSEEVFFWESSSNNRLLATGRGSLVLNAISALRDAEDQDSALAGKIALAPALAGPASRLGAHSVVKVYTIWRFGRNQDAAKQFLVDLALAYREPFLRSRYYNLPAFPEAVPDLAQLVTQDERAQPPGKYALLADAEKWSINFGHPGHSNAATDEVFNQFIVPKMFAAAARGEMSAEESVRTAEAQIKPIFDKWRERGKI